MKELQVARRMETDEEDEPPLLELEEDDTRKSPADNQREDEREEEASLMDEMMTVAHKAKEQKRQLQEKERNSKSFGQGLKKGFFNAKPRKDAAAATTVSGHKKRMPTGEQTKKMPTREELLIVKPPQQQESNQTTAEKQSPFVFPEVQSALQSMNQLDPKAWMDAKFFEKLARNPKLALALQNPRFTQAIDEMQRDPEAAIRKYRKDKDVSVMLQDFMAFLGSHFEEARSANRVYIAILGKEQEGAMKQQQQQSGNNQQDMHSTFLIQPSVQSSPVPKAAAIVDLDEARREAIASMERTPEEDAQVQQILKNPELLQALSDATLMQRLQTCKDSPQELRRLQQDPALARKLQLLVDAKLVQFA